MGRWIYVSNLINFTMSNSDWSHENLVKFVVRTSLIIITYFAFMFVMSSVSMLTSD